ncbi:dTDP-4-dehydrorhamnose 3,5-epimerase [Rhodopirellula sallentina]|uniref:dTDP-4-dehydrorhamnose 3,5-epimerase n=1 Tax=Rhodopirellula sallentina SM41 TaxID=1263870 RepID=M5U3F4_9BACT|nr:dTDP-4-dehydrorhamnose 3,5-epimerase [Rhodopirellula sallentina]EMI55784.1 dtdp-4-dehydrorhamnose 3,5-epimerase [Rhodopirellula sallentina SM41]
MRFLPTRFADAWLIEPDLIADQRGFFARTWCQREFTEFGLDSDLVQCSVSFNRNAGTLRGMHFQTAPHEETKLVRCTRGSILDVIVDLRKKSKTFGVHECFELNAENHRSVYIPKGFAHGFQTLEPESEVFYQMAHYYHAESAAGFHYKDLTIGIAWPIEASCVSEKDERLPSFDEALGMNGCGNAVKNAAQHSPPGPVSGRDQA